MGEQEVNPTIVGKRDVLRKFCDDDDKSAALEEIGPANSKSKPAIHIQYVSNDTSTAIPVVDDTVPMRPCACGDPFWWWSAFGDGSTLGKDVVKLTSDDGNVCSGIDSPRNEGKCIEGCVEFGNSVL